MTLTADDAATFSRCISVGGVAVFPADTVYGLACEPDSKEAVQRLYLLKRRRPDKPAAVMFFTLELALAALPELGPRTSDAVGALLPGVLEGVPEAIRARADLVLDGGELPGTPSTVVDLRTFERDGRWSVVREGAVAMGDVAAALGSPP
jgi:L-threonylcarbamoyladenylate synthase